MPRRELSRPSQIADWLADWGEQLSAPAELVLIGSGGLLWHAHVAGSNVPLPSQSMDVDPVTESDEIAELCYAALIGSEFEREHGWHVNLMPGFALDALPAGWEQRASRAVIGNLHAIIPAAADLLAPKLKRGEPRDHEHFSYARSIGIID
ncbi:MAG: hypothetical protein R3F11_17130 [Verrucomicrobiales bacterium]